MNDDKVHARISIDDHGVRLRAIAERYGWTVEQVIEECFRLGLKVLEETNSNSA